MATKYNIVTGWKRGGTSALMLALRQCGIPVIGHKHPFGYKTIEGKVDTNVGSYFPIESKAGYDNPTGFWEVPDICNINGLTKRWDEVGFDGDLVKVPFDRLVRSEKDMINNVIIIIRDPRKVLESQRKAGMLKEDPKIVRVSALQTLFIAVNSIYWLREKQIPFYMILYEELLKNPTYQLKGACSFFGRGDPKWGGRVIRKGLDRSKKIKYKSKELKRLFNFYKDLRDKSQIADYDLHALADEIKNLDSSGYVKFIENKESVEEKYNIEHINKED